MIILKLQGVYKHEGFKYKGLDLIYKEYIAEN